MSQGHCLALGINKQMQESPIRTRCRRNVSRQQFAALNSGKASGGYSAVESGIYSTSSRKRPTIPEEPNIYRHFALKSSLVQPSAPAKA